MTKKFKAKGRATGSRGTSSAAAAAAAARAESPTQWVDDVQDPATLTGDQLAAVYALYANCNYIRHPAKMCHDVPTCLKGLRTETDTALLVKRNVGEPPIKSRGTLTNDQKNSAAPMPPALGLKNLGNTCYANAVLQVLFGSERFRSAVYRAFEMNGKGRSSAKGGISPAMIRVIANLFARMEGGLRTIDAVDAKEFFTELDIPTSVQQDAHEFLNLFFMMLAADKGLVGDHIKSDLTGTQRHVRQCGECARTTVMAENFHYISAPVAESSTGAKKKGAKPQVTLEECLGRVVAVESLTENNLYGCEACGKEVEGTSKTDFVVLPDTLIVHLLRFTYDAKTATRHKVSTAVEFPSVLDMTPFVSSKSGQPQVDPADHQYLLSAVVLHHGNKPDHGHYTADVRRGNALDSNAESPSEGSWWHFDDSAVTASNAYYTAATSSQKDKKKKKEARSADDGETPTPAPHRFTSTDVYMLVYSKQPVTTSTEECVEVSPAPRIPTCIQSEFNVTNNEAEGLQAVWEQDKSRIDDEITRWDTVAGHMATNTDLETEYVVAEDGTAVQHEFYFVPTLYLRAIGSGTFVEKALHAAELSASDEEAVGVPSNRKERSSAQAASRQDSQAESTSKGEGTNQAEHEAKDEDRKSRAHVTLSSELDLSALLCRHKKLSPHLPRKAYRVIRDDFWEALVEHYGVKSKPVKALKVSEAMCQECAADAVARMKQTRASRDDRKRMLDISIGFEGEEGVYVSPDFFDKWRRNAEFITTAPPETDLSANLLCEHGNLKPTAGAAAVPRTVFDKLITTYKLTCGTVLPSTTSPCDQCIREQQAETMKVHDTKQARIREQKQFPTLFSYLKDLNKPLFARNLASLNEKHVAAIRSERDRNLRQLQRELGRLIDSGEITRIEFRKRVNDARKELGEDVVVPPLETHYACVPLKWVQEWRKYITDTTGVTNSAAASAAVPPPGAVPTADCICPCGKLLFDMDSLKRIGKTNPPECIVVPMEEYKELQDHYSTGPLVELTEMGDERTLTPQPCTDCIAALDAERLAAKTKFTDGQITVQGQIKGRRRGFKDVSVKLNGIHYGQTLGEIAEQASLFLLQDEDAEIVPTEVQFVKSGSKKGSAIPLSHEDTLEEAGVVNGGTLRVGDFGPSAKVVGSKATVHVDPTSVAETEPSSHDAAGAFERTRLQGEWQPTPPSSQPTATLGYWECSACTFHNTNLKSKVCDICGTPRQ